MNWENRLVWANSDSSPKRKPNQIGSQMKPQHEETKRNWYEDCAAAMREFVLSLNVEDATCAETQRFAVELLRKSEEVLMQLNAADKPKQLLVAPKDAQQREPEMSKQDANRARMQFLSVAATVVEKLSDLRLVQPPPWPAELETLDATAHAVLDLYLTALDK
jgi:hypothetical protein